MIQTLSREYLETYIYLESEIKRIRRRIQYYADHPSSQISGVVKGSLPNFPYTECHFVVSGPSIKSSDEREKNIHQLAIDLSGNEQMFSDMKLDIETFLEHLPISMIEIKHILALKYVERMTDEEIAEKTYMSRRTLNRKIDRFLDSGYQISDFEKTPTTPI